MGILFDLLAGLALFVFLGSHYGKYGGDYNYSVGSYLTGLGLGVNLLTPLTVYLVFIISGRFGLWWPFGIVISFFVTILWLGLLVKIHNFYEDMEKSRRKLAEKAKD